MQDASPISPQECGGASGGSAARGKDTRAAGHLISGINHELARTNRRGDEADRLIKAIGKRAVEVIAEEKLNHS